MAVLLVAFALWKTKKTVETPQSYQEETPLLTPQPEETPAVENLNEGGAAKIESVSDLDNLGKEIDSTEIDIEQDLNQLDKDFAAF